MCALPPVSYAWARERSSFLGATARRRFGSYRFAALDGSSSPCNVYLRLSWLLCGLPLCCSWNSAVVGAPRPLCTGSWALCWLSMYPSWMLCCLLCLGSWALLVPLCDCPWALPCLRYLSGWLCYLLLCRLRGSVDSCARTRGRSCAPCAAACGSCAVYRGAARDGCPALCVVVLGCCVAPCLTTSGAPLFVRMSFLPCVLTALLRDGLAPFLFDSSLASQCRLSTEALGSRTPSDESPSCSSAGGRPHTQVPRVYPRVAVSALHLGTKVANSDRRSAASRALFAVSGPRSYLSRWRLLAIGMVPWCESHLRAFGTLWESMHCAVGSAARGWLRVCRAHPRPPAVVVHMGTVPLATIPGVFRRLPRH